MRAQSLLLALAVLLALSTSVSAAHIRVEGHVKELQSLRNMKDAYVRLYKDGIKIKAHYTKKNGRFQFRLQNNAIDVIRVSAPGHITKCFQIDTHGAAWVGDHSVSLLKVDMTMMEEVKGFDHSYFDMPLGLAKYNPTTGFLSWSKKYEAQLTPELVQLMEEYNDRVELYAALIEP